MDIVIGIGVFVALVLLIEGGYFAFRTLRNLEKKRIRRRLRTLTAEGYGNEDIDITRKRLFSEVPWLNRLLLKFSWTERMNLLLVQAGIKYPLGFFGLSTLLLAFIGFLAGSWITTSYLMAILWAAGFGMIPFLYVYSKKKRRMQKFQRQLPDALELIGRSLKAGHAFPGGLKMVGDEFDDPTGTEFGRTLDEINFGVGTNDALKNLSRRVDCPDLKFFVISVILQRDTGGNLAEILENIAYLIRERFKLQGHIRALSAEGRLSAVILVLLPFIVTLVLSLINPGYVATLLTDPIGRIMAIFAITLMALGVLVIKRMIQIRI